MFCFYLICFQILFDLYTLFPGADEGQGSLAGMLQYARSHKELDMTEWLNKYILLNIFN